MRSKALKARMDQEPTWKLKLKAWWYSFWPVDKIYDLIAFFHRLNRAIKWAKFMWTNWDFDAATIFPLLERKLIRIEYNLKNGHAVHEVKNLKALRIAIKLAHRLSNTYHEDKYNRWHDKKWGDLIIWFTPYDKEGYSKFNSKRTKIKTQEDESEERKDHLELYSKYSKWLDRDSRNLFAIIHKYWSFWWD